MSIRIHTKFKKVNGTCDGSTSDQLVSGSRDDWDGDAKENDGA